MVATDSAGLRQRALAPGDVAGAMDLVAEAGWNQVADDWALMQRMGDAIGLVDAGGRLVATALALPYPADADRSFGWISMVLVSGEMRRQGLATRLLRDRIAWLQSRDLVPILDATEAGEKVYLPLGFGPGLRISRWQGQGQAGTGAVAGDCADSAPRLARADDLAALARVDRVQFGSDRAGLITAFLARPGSVALVAGTPACGFGIVRAGRRAAQIGPLLAADEAVAAGLLDGLLALVSGPVFLDLLDARPLLRAQLLERGFTRQRGYLRMALGASPGSMPDFDRGGRTMVIAGPEYG